MDFDKRPLSWSAISSFEYDPAQWHRKYILNIQDPPSKEMMFGSLIGKRIETDPTYLPEITRHSKMEHPFTVVYDGIKMIGFADTFCDKTFTKLGEYKTGKKAWDQKRVDGHRQINMYLLMNYITNKVKPEDVEVDLFWLPTEETGSFEIKLVEPVKVKKFRTKRSMVDILTFAAQIKETVKQMQKYVDNNPPYDIMDKSVLLK